MKFPIILLACLLVTLCCCGPHKKLLPLEFRTFKIGYKVDTALFRKYKEIYIPNHLDGWTTDNVERLPEKFVGLPVATWILKSDSAVAVTLLKDIVINISISGMSDAQKSEIATAMTEHFGQTGKVRRYKQNVPLQEWVEYWELTTWETASTIVEIGKSDLRKPGDALPATVVWNMVYSDQALESVAVEKFKATIFSNREDSTRYVNQVKAHHNRAHPPRNGIYTDYFENGKLKERGRYKGGMKEGLWETWYENGQKEDSACYKEDQLAEARIMWHANGQLLLISYWGKPDDRIGIWKRYYESGKIESITSFNNEGELDGENLDYYESGKIKRRTIYSKESIMSDISYDEQGHIVK